ncbi:MAG: hypothetical protein ACYTDY_19915 [Planctomycetota bacterium]|jgi:hypothetical protein
MDEFDRGVLRHHTMECLREWWTTLDQIGQTAGDTWDEAGLATFLDVAAIGFSDTAGTLRRERIMPGLDLAAVILQSAAEGIRKLEAESPDRDVGPMPLGPETTRALLAWEWEGVTAAGGSIDELKQRLRRITRGVPPIRLDDRALLEFLGRIAEGAQVATARG